MSWNSRSKYVEKDKSDVVCDPMNQKSNVNLAIL